MFSANRLQGILAGINGILMIIVPDADNVINRVLGSLIAMGLTYLIAHMLRDATGAELKKKAEQEAERRRLRSNFQWESLATRQAYKEKYRDSD